MEHDVQEGQDTTPRSTPSSTGLQTVKTAAATVAGIAIGATLTEPARAQTTAPEQRGTLRIVVHEGEIALDTLQEAIVLLMAQFKPNGCTGCGLLGYDLLIQRGYPPLAQFRAGGNVLGAVETF
jgi:hypothetical protein